MFNYFEFVNTLILCAFKLNKFNEEENKTATIYNILHLFTFHVTKRFSFNILKTVSLKLEKKTSAEARSKGHALVHNMSESHLAD